MKPLPLQEATRCVNRKIMERLDVEIHVLNYLLRFRFKNCGSSSLDEYHND